MSSALLISILAILAVFSWPALLVLVIVNYNYRKHRLQHEERMAAISKGLPIIEPTVPAKSRNPYIWPLVLIALGLALVIGNILADEIEDIGWGLVPMFIGGALLTAQLLAHNKKKDKAADADIKAVTGHNLGKAIDDAKAN